MGILEEIKRAEKEAEELKSRAEREGMELLQEVRGEYEKRLGEVIREGERLREIEILNLKDYIAERIKGMEKEYGERIMKLKELSIKNRESAIKRAMEIILKWPSSVSRR